MAESLVSIVMPAYNRAHLIGETIQSVLDQSYSNWELIIIDDGSTDDSRTIINEFNDQRIQYYAIEHYGILGKVRNVGMNYSKGSYIAFLDSDDLWLPHKLVFQLALFKKYPQASFAFGHGEQFGSGAIPPPELETLFVGNVFYPILLKERFVFYVPTIIFKKAILEKIIAIDESLLSGGDIDFFLRMAHVYEGIFSNEIVVKIRKHEQSHSQRLEFVAYEEYLDMIKRFLRKDFLTSMQYHQIASKQCYKLGLLYLNQNNHQKAAECFGNFVKIKPFNPKGWIRWIQSALLSGLASS
jgi:glycosyltransferase involved in cell wall biosynthesis